MQFKRKKNDHHEYTWKVEHRDITILFAKRKDGGWKSWVYDDQRPYDKIVFAKTINEAAQKVAANYDAYLESLVPQVDVPEFTEIELAEVEPIEPDTVEIEIDFGKEVTVTKSPAEQHEEQVPFEALVFEETCKLISRTFSGAKRYFMRKTAKYVPFGAMIVESEE